ncbi:MAG: hypothetical protein N3G21_08835 [Candidatus Hydrogenedentes bacterium]|nr:hypothetical protein [Candidatus Hydrogenedentota bacterium]
MNLLKSTKNKTAILLITLTLLLLWLLLVFIIIFSFSPKAQAYKNFIQNETIGIIILQPYKIQNYISKLAPSYTKWIKQIPRFTSLQPGPIRLEWFHNLPREISLLFNHIPNIGNEVYFVVNEKRNSEVFVNEVNDSGFIRNLCFTKWDSSKLSLYKDAIWYAKGYYQVEFEKQGFILQPLQENLITNKHLLEIYWDNTNSDLAKLKELIISCYRPKGITPYLSCLDYLSHEISWLHLYLNLNEDNLVYGILRVSSTSNTQSTDLCLQQFVEWIKSQLPNDISLEVNLSEINGNIITWEIIFSQFEHHLRRLLGSN